MTDGNKSEAGQQFMANQGMAAEWLSGEAPPSKQSLETHGSWKTRQRLLAAVGPSPVSEQVVRRAARLAGLSHSPWIALYVETPRTLGESDHAQITRILALAEELGAEVVTTTDEDLVSGLLRVAAQRNVTQIVCGKFARSRWPLFQGDPIFRGLVRESGEMEIHLVPVEQEKPAKFFRRRQILDESAWLQYLIAVGTVAVATPVAFLLGPVIGGPHAAALVTLLTVVVLGSFVSRGPTLVAAALSALLWDYLILPPIYAFRINKVEDALLFGMYFVVGLTMGQLTTRIRAQQKAERSRQERATALYLLTRELNEATILDQIVQRAIQQMEQAFKAKIVVLLTSLPDQPAPAPHDASTFKFTQADQRGDRTGNERTGGARRRARGAGSAVRQPDQHHVSVGDRVPGVLHAGGLHVP